jgi:hypothetical protein
MDLPCTTTAYLMKRKGLSEYFVHALQAAFAIVSICLLLKVTTSAHAQENRPPSVPAPPVGKATATEPAESKWWGLKLGDWFQLAGALATAGTVLYAALQLRANRRIAEGQFLLHLDEMSHKHDDIRLRLRKEELRRENLEGDTGMNAEDEYALVDYLGFFELIHRLIENRSVKPEIVMDLYSYQLQTIKKNTDLWHLVEKNYRWLRLKDLVEKYGATSTQR